MSPVKCKFSCIRGETTLHIPPPETYRICSYRSQFPVWFQALDGNTADKASFADTIRAYLDQLRGSPSPYFVADSALYTTANLTKLSDVRFITRVPEAVKDLYQSIPVDSMQPAALKGYRYQWVDSTFGDVPQRWLVVYSQAAFDRESATLEKQIAKAKGVAETSLKRMSHKTYETAEAAEAALAAASQSWKYHTCCFSIDRVPHYTKPGRPRKTEEPTHFRYRIEGKVVAKVEAIETLKRSKGRFVLATNELDDSLLDAATLLSVYKAQNVSVERGFRFLKDPLFFAERLYLEKPERIMALLMVMALSLLVYSLAERWVRTELVKREQTIPNQVGKPTQNPTLRYRYISQRTKQPNTPHDSKPESNTYPNYQHIRNRSQKSLFSRFITAECRHYARFRPKNGVFKFKKEELKVCRHAKFLNQIHVSMRLFFKIRIHSL